MLSSPPTRPSITAPKAGRLERRARLELCGQLWLLDVLACALVCGEYLDAVAPATLRGWLFVQGGRLSCAASLSLVPGLLVCLAASLTARRRVLAPLAALLWSVYLLAVYVDTRIYGIFRYHFNGLVWNVLTTPGADEAVQLSRADLALLIGAALALVLAHLSVFAFLWRRAEGRASSARRTPLLARPGLAWRYVLVPVMLAVGGVYAWADLVRDPQVMAYARVYPIYPRLTIKRFADRLGFDLAGRARVDLPASGILLGYPRQAPALPPDGPRPNVLLIVVDSLRADMLAPETMPRTTALAAKGRVFRDHLSSGNATRFGLFGLLYGLHGSYWNAVCHEHRSPVLVDALLERGYAFRVLTSASMDFPEFRSTAWVRVEADVEDRLPFERPGGRDDGVARRFDEWLGERAGDAAPFFSFLLLDAPHQRYWFPEESVRFRPYVDDVAYAELADGATPELRTALFNRYRNAVAYADETIGRVLDSLAAHGHTEDTLVLVTGDHGEEFFESGLWGHTSDFTRAQVHVPLVLSGPGVSPGEETRPTCHIDVPATLLELMGAPPALRKEWTLGASLLDPPAGRARVVSGWDTLGVHVDGAILEVPMAAHGGATIAVYDESWQRIFDDEVVLEREGRWLGVLALDCRRFLR